MSGMEWQALQLSLGVALRSVLLGLPIAIGLAWLLARRRFPGRAMLDALVHLPLVLPPVAIGYLLLVLFGARGAIGEWLHAQFGLQLAFTRAGAVLATLVMSLPLMVRAIRVSFEHLDPGLEAAARSLGAGRLDCLYVLDVTMARCRLLRLCPLRRKSVARWSSRAGCDGRPPLKPKSLGVSTMPVPKW